MYSEGVNCTRMKKISRRDFLRNVGLGTAGLTLFARAANATEQNQRISGDNLPLKIRKLQETPSVCAYCGCGCGILLYTSQGKLVHLEGDPDNPINEGTLCPKGIGISDANVVVKKRGVREPNPNRITKPLYRAPGSSKWEEKDWEWTLKTIARRFKKTRDESFEKKDDNGVTVNRTLAIAHFGSASLDNEENYILQKMMRAAGLVNIEHHARL